MNKWPPLALTGLILLACAASSPTWSRPGVSQAEAQADLSNCKRQADSDLRDQGAFRHYDGDGGAMDDSMALADHQQLLDQQNVMVADCMQGKGYKEGR